VANDRQADPASVLEVVLAFTVGWSPSDRDLASPVVARGLLRL